MAEPTRPIRALGRYQVIDVLARGGMGEVLRARDPVDGSLVAIKRVLPGKLTAAIRRRFGREARILANLDHPNVIAVHDVGGVTDEDPAGAFIVMELIAGESLEARLARMGSLPAEQAVAIATKLASALEAAHAHGVIHRDVKPDNVILREGDDEPVLIDFGIAGRERGAAAGADEDRLVSHASLTLEGRFLGTAGYCAPEQAMGELGKIGPASDVYGLGATLYAMLTGRPPFQASSLIEVMTAQLRSAPEAPSASRPGVPRCVDEACLAALCPQPERRTPTAEAFAQALAGRPSARGGRGRRGAAIAVAAVVVAATGLAALALGRGLGATASTAPPEVAAEVAADRPPAEPSTARESGPPAAPPPVSTDEPASLDALLDEGMRLGNANEPQRALEVFELAIELAPASGEAWHGRGSVRTQLGDLDGAIEDETRAIGLLPEYAGAWAGRGTALAMKKQFEAALADLDHAIELDPGAGLYWFNRGYARLGSGDAEGALPDLDRAVELLPDLARAFNARASARRKLRDPDGALEDLDRVVQLTPDDASAWVARAELRIRSQSPLEGAIEDADRAIALEPENARAWWARGTARLQRDDAGGTDDLDRSLALAPPTTAKEWSTKAGVRRLLGDTAGAIAAFDRALELAPRDTAKLNDRAYTKIEHGDLEGAIADCDRALAIDPRHAYATGTRGEARRARGDLEGALADMRRFIELAPRDRHAATFRKWIAELETEIGQRRRGDDGRSGGS